MTIKKQKTPVYNIVLKIKTYFMMFLCTFLFIEESMAAVPGEPVPSCTAQDYTYEVFNVVPNGACLNLTDTINVKFSVLVTGNPDRFDLSIGYTKAGESTLIDVRCLNTPGNYDVNGGGCNDYDSNNSPITATSDLNVSCDVDGNLLVDPFINVDFYLNWDIDTQNGHDAEITSPKCKTNVGESLPLAPAKLTLLKNVINNNSGTAVATDWTLSANIGGGTAEVTGTTGVSSSILAGGDYVLSESSGPGGYSLTGISCPGGTYDVTTKTLSLAPADDITCTFTNDDISLDADIYLSKALTAESGSISGIVEGKETLTYTITLSNTGQTDGTIVINEIVPAGTTFIASGNDFSTAACINGAPAGTVCSLTSPNVPALSSINMTFIIVADNKPLSETSIENIVIENGTTPPTCSPTENSDPRCVSTPTELLTTQPNITLKKTSLTLSDPINGTTNPKAIPGALSEYTIQATNTGFAPADTDSIIITDAIPANTALYVNDISGAGTGPIRFNTLSSGLSYNFVSLGSTSDGLSFSNNGGTSYDYLPSANAEGVDTSVTHVRIATLGEFLAANSWANPKFTVLFRVKVQ